MPDWTAPFHRPHLTTEEFEKQKADYVAKYGYTIDLPGLSDIIHLKAEKPLSEDEKEAWKRKDVDFFSPERYDDIKKMKQKRKERYLQMLGSPTPHVIRTAGSILTSIDDAQDALTTLHVIGRIAIKLAPRILGKMFLGPVGWILTAIDVMNLIMHIGRMGTLPMVSKRTKDAATAENPFSKKAKIKRASRLLRTFPSKGEIIEILQTTDQVFGVGICLGPIVGAVQDIVSGAIRQSFGQPVRINPDLPAFPPWTAAAQRSCKGMTLYMGAGHVTNDMEMLEMMAASYFAQQELLVGQADWNPLDHIVDVQNTEVMAPYPTNILSLEVIEEEGIPIQETIGWPHNESPWAASNDIVNEYDFVAAARLKSFIGVHQHDWMGFSAGNLATGSGMYAMANIEGEDAVSYDYTAQSKLASILLENGLTITPEQPAEQILKLATWIDGLEYSGEKPTLKSIVEFTDREGILLEKF